MKFLERFIICVIAASPLYLIRFSVLKIPFTLFEVLILTSVIATVFVGVVNLEQRKIFIKKITAIPVTFWIATTLFFIASVISIFVAPDSRAALGIWRSYIVEAMLLGFVSYLNLSSFQSLRKLAVLFSVVAAGVAGYAVIQKFTGIGIPNPFWQAESTRRVTSVFGYPNAVGLYLELIIPFVIAAIVVTKSIGARVWFGTVLVASCLAILWAESSGTIAALAGTVGIALLLYKRTRVAIIIAGIIFGAAILISPLRKPFADEFLLQGFSGQIRTSMWKETVLMLEPRAVVGAGLTGYQARVAPYHILKHVEIYLYPHNLVLTLWSELGLLGLGAFLWVLGMVVVWMVQVLRKGSREARVWGAAVLGVISIIVLHGLVDVPYFKNDFSALFWVLVAIALLVRYTGISSSIDEHDQKNLD